MEDDDETDREGTPFVSERRQRGVAPVRRQGLREVLSVVVIGYAFQMLTSLLVDVASGA
jgi:hypothetical protein